MVVDVAGDEHALDLRAGLVAHDEVAQLVDIEQVPEEVGVRLVADGHEQAVDGQRPTGLRRPCSRSRRPCDLASPRTSSTEVFRWTSILGWASARSSMILLARSVSRRWSRWTFVAKRVRKSASSRAVSPPPTTAISLSRKKKPSQVAQALTPRPRRRVSLSRPSHSAEAPVATITASPRYSTPARPDPERPAGEVDPVDVDVDDPAAEALGLGPEGGHQLGALDAVGEARVVLDVAGDHQLAARARSRPGRSARGWPARRRSRPSGRPGPSRRSRPGPRPGLPGSVRSRPGSTARADQPARTRSARLPNDDRGSAGRPARVVCHAPNPITVRILPGSIHGRAHSERPEVGDHVRARSAPGGSGRRRRAG